MGQGIVFTPPETLPEAFPTYKITYYMALYREKEVLYLQRVQDFRSTLK